MARRKLLETVARALGPNVTAAAAGRLLELDQELGELIARGGAQLHGSLRERAAGVLARLLSPRAEKRASGPRRRSSDRSRRGRP